MSLELVVIVILTLLLIVSVFYNIRFALTILRVQDSIEESLDLLDERYTSMSKILDIPLFHDSNEVRNVVEDIRVSRDTVLAIARSLASIDESAIETDVEGIGD